MLVTINNANASNSSQSSQDKTLSPKGFGSSHTLKQAAGGPPITGSKTKRSSSKRKKKSSPEQQDLAAARQYAQGRGKPPPIDPEVAAKGRVDRVKVKDWGSGARENLGELEIDHQQQSDMPPADNGPLYDLLGCTLEQLQGALRIAVPEGTPPTPPIQQWSFKSMRYVQYLFDQSTVHGVLERCLEAAVQRAVDVGHSNEGSAALAIFAPTAAKLARSFEATRDLTAIARALPQGEPIALTATQQATAHAELIKQLSKRTVDDESTAIARQRACCQLLCHAYALYVTQLTSGMRLGALAADKLQLADIDALSFFTNYPMNNPMQQFCQGIDAAGEVLQPPARKEVLVELPRAFKHASLLMSALAHIDCL